MGRTLRGKAGHQLRGPLPLLCMAVPHDGCQRQRAAQAHRVMQRQALGRPLSPHGTASSTHLSRTHGTSRLARRQPALRYLSLLTVPLPFCKLEARLAHLSAALHRFACPRLAHRARQLIRQCHICRGAQRLNYFHVGLRSHLAAAARASLSTPGSSAHFQARQFTLPQCSQRIGTEVFPGGPSGCRSAH